MRPNLPKSSLRLAKRLTTKSELAVFYTSRRIYSFLCSLFVTNILHLSLRTDFVPILSSKEGPLYHARSRGSLENPVRFSPVRPLHGTYTTSDSYQGQKIVMRPISLRLSSKVRERNQTRGKRGGERREVLHILRNLYKDEHTLNPACFRKCLSFPVI